MALRVPIQTTQAPTTVRGIKRRPVGIMKELSTYAGTFAPDGKRKTVSVLCDAISQSNGYYTVFDKSESRISGSMSVVHGGSLDLKTALRDVADRSHLDHGVGDVISRLAGPSEEVEEFCEMLRRYLVRPPSKDRHSKPSSEYRYLKPMEQKGKDVVDLCRDEVRRMYACRLQFDPSLMG